MVSLRLAGLDMLDDNPLFPGPFQQLIDPDYLWLAAPFDDPVQV